MVSTCTASASDSSRRLRSSSAVSVLGRRRCAAQPAPSARWCRAARSVAAACRSWPTWRRSVSRRSPSTACEHAAGQALAERDRLESATATPRRAAPAPSGAGGGGRLPGVLVGGGDLLGASSRGRRERRRRARGGEAGRSIASSSRSHSRAGAVPNTLPAPLMTAGTPTSSSASRTSAALRLVRTSTAMWPGRTALAPRVAVLGADSISRPRTAARRCRRRGRGRCARGRPAPARSPLRGQADPSSRCSDADPQRRGTGAPVRRGARLAAAARTWR